jgi:hypothetical protein
MIAIGFRAEPSVVNWAVVQGSSAEPVLLGADKLTAPASFDEGAALTWFRDRTQYLVQTYSPNIAAVRSPETFMPRNVKLSSLYQRCRLEGVVIEALHSSGIHVLTGALATISKNIGSKGAKHYLETPDLRGLDWSKYDTNRREAILVAASALS